ncbi:unnamed protein product, partial [Amoebophrya sp. A25]
MNLVLERCLFLVADPQGAVRRELLRLLEEVLAVVSTSNSCSATTSTSGTSSSTSTSTTTSTVSSRSSCSQLRPFAALLRAQIKGALSHVDAGVKQTGVQLVSLFFDERNKTRKHDSTTAPTLGQ